MTFYSARDMLSDRHYFITSSCIVSCDHVTSVVICLFMHASILSAGLSVLPIIHFVLASFISLLCAITIERTLLTKILHIIIAQVLMCLANFVSFTKIAVHDHRFPT